MGFPADEPQGAWFVLQKDHSGCCVENRLWSVALKQRGHRRLYNHKGEQWGWDHGSGIEGTEKGVGCGIYFENGS